MPIITTDGLVDDAAEAASIPIAQWGIAAGSADVIEVVYPTPITELTDGLIVGFRAVDPNATTTPTFVPDENTPHTIVKNSGALEVADIVEDGEYLVRYNATLQVWKLLNPGAF